MNKQQLKCAYKKYPFLKKIDFKHNGELGKSIIYRKLNSGEVIKTDSMDCPGFMIILKGKFKIEKIDDEGRVISLYELSDGEICHESLSCYLKSERLYIIGYAVTDLEIGIIPIQDINKYIISEDIFWKFSYTQLYKKFSGIVLDKEERIHLSVEERIVKALIEKGTPVIYITHEQLAHELGTAREVVSRNLKVLQEKGQLIMKRGKIKLNI